MGNSRNSLQHGGRRSLSSAFVLVVAATVLALSVNLISCSNSGSISPDPNEVDPSKISQTDPPASNQAAKVTVLEGESLTIPISELSEQARFYPVVVDGVRMEVIAVYAADGTVRTAFNTCQVCYDSGRGYYKQRGSVLVCQNCGNQFPMSRVETQVGGCNPLPIPAGEKTVDDEAVHVPFEFLKRNAAYFANWGKPE